MEQLVDGAPARPEQVEKCGCDPERHDRQRRLLTLLRTVFPEVFPSSPPVPLAVGIRRQLAQVACDDTFQWQDVAAVLRLWTRRQDYIAAVARGELRRNLDGSIAGEPTESHRAYAARRLTTFQHRG